MTDTQTMEDRNTEIVLDMWEKVIRQGSADAVMKYIHPDYIQHNVNMPSGREYLLHLVKLINNKPADFTPPGHKEVLKTVAQGDYVVVIWNQEQADPNDPGQTYMGQAFDMFRLEDGIICEHWDDTRKWPRPWSDEKPEDEA